MTASYHDLLTALADLAGLNPASLLATQEIVLDDLPISLQLSGEGEQAEILLCSLLGDVPEDRWPEVARYLLMANHLWTGTGGATLGLLDKDNTVSLSIRQSLNGLDAQQLSRLLAQVADIGLAWQDFIAQSQAPSSPATAASATTDGLRV